MRADRWVGALAWVSRPPIRPSRVAAWVWAANRQGARRAVLTALALLIVVALAHGVSGARYSFSVFYLLVVVRVSATGREAYLIPTAAVTAMTWSLVESASRSLEDPWLPLAWNSAARFAVLAFTGLLVAAVVGVARVEREVSRTDPLTGLHNRRGFYDAVELEFARSAGSRKPLSVAFLDVDGFKAVNDRQGHAAGDRLLTEIARTLGSQVRRNDLLARLGGDEFVAVLPDTGAAAAAAVAQRAARALDEMCSSGGWSVGFSIGMATFEEPAHSVAELISEADRLMYLAKRTSPEGGGPAVVVTGVRAAAGLGDARG